MDQATSTDGSAMASGTAATGTKSRDRPSAIVPGAAPVRVATEGESPGRRTAAIDLTGAGWLMRDLRRCTGIVLVFQAIYLSADWRIGASHATIMALHLLNILNAAIFLGLTYIRSNRDRMPQFILGGLTLL